MWMFEGLFIIYESIIMYSYFYLFIIIILRKNFEVELSFKFISAKLQH